MTLPANRRRQAHRDDMATPQEETLVAFGELEPACAKAGVAVIPIPPSPAVF